MDVLYILADKLKTAGIPIVGVSGNEPPYRIDFDPAATPAQRSQAAGIAAAFDPTAEEQAVNQARLNRKAVVAQIESELAYLDATIPNIDTMTAGQVRIVVKRLAQESRGVIEILAWLSKRLD